MNKFIIAEIPNNSELDNSLPVLYKVHIGTKYYLHKGKTLKESLDKLLDDVFRGIRGKKFDDRYSKVVDYCKRYPAVQAVTVHLISNSEPRKILKLEDAMYKKMSKDELSLNRLDIPPYKPEWMLKEAFQARCENCVTNGIIGGKKTKFKFCCNCGRLIK